MTVLQPLIVGVGNAWRHDDAAGLAVARLVGGVELTGEVAGLVEVLGAHHAVIAVDAVASGAGPGTIHRFDAAATPLPGGFRSASTHALGLAEAIELARALDALPAQLVVYGIEGADFSAGEGLSAAVADAVERAAALIAEEIVRA